MCGMWEACVLCLHPHSDLSKRQTLVLRLQAAATNRGSLLPSQVSCRLSGLKSKITFSCQKACKGTSLISSPILLTSHKLQWWWMSAFDLHLYMYFYLIFRCRILNWNYFSSKFLIIFLKNVLQRNSSTKGKKYIYFRDSEIDCRIYNGIE